MDWEVIVEKQPTSQNRFRVLLACIFAAVPSVYILSVNFLGLNQMILNLGQAVQIRPDFINESWPLSFEYLILVSFFIFATWLAYGVAGLKTFSISLSLLAGIGVIYLVDTIWPYGTFKPMQLLAVPTSACATALLDLLGYNATLTYPVSSPEYGTLPLMTVSTGGETIRATVAWPCAGVHSLLLFTLITLVFFKKTTMQKERKIIFFLIGAAGTYLTNILRIASYFTISISYGSETGIVFHNSYGELYFIAWMLLYFIIIIAIQSGKISRLTQAFRKRLKVLRINGADQLEREKRLEETRWFRRNKGGDHAKHVAPRNDEEIESCFQAHHLICQQ
ncbi:MAG: archaeosortase/exosortase family protein [Candidatus Bathyarchaeota archaeon]|nr:archaeosortase/exosortase family protein [Candidatus Bathyarchaeota archaeon]